MKRKWQNYMVEPTLRTADFLIGSSVLEFGLDGWLSRWLRVGWVAGVRRGGLDENWRWIWLSWESGSSGSVLRAELELRNGNCVLSALLKTKHYEVFSYTFFIF